MEGARCGAQVAVDLNRVGRPAQQGCTMKGVKRCVRLRTRRHVAVYEQGVVGVKRGCGWAQGGGQVGGQAWFARDARWSRSPAQTPRTWHEVLNKASTHLVVLGQRRPNQQPTNQPPPPPPKRLQGTGAHLVVLSQRRLVLAILGPHLAVVVGDHALHVLWQRGSEWVGACEAGG